MTRTGKNLGGRPPKPEGRLSFQGLRIDEEDWLTLEELYGGRARAHLLRELVAAHLGKEGVTAPETPDPEKVTQARERARARIVEKKHTNK